MQFNQKCVWMLGEILIQNGWVTWDQLEQALTVQKENNRILGEILIENRFVNRPTLYRALAAQYEMAFVELSHFIPQPQAIKMVPKRIAYEYRIMPLVHRDETLLVAISAPNAVWPEHAIVWHPNVSQIRTVLCCPEDIATTLEHYYGPEGAAAA
ncbi:MAG: hypothetical protein HYZ85_05495 [Candidatus Omnitrophica bacterium]|nr:hypothetical protein [Candidatus Omnitrophota bacterium]